MSNVELSVFQLEANRNYETEIYGVPKGSTIRFTLGPSLYGHDVSLFINNPPKDDVPFVRTSYRRLDWDFHSAKYADEGNAFVDCKFSSSGTFRFYISLDDSKEESSSGYILVNPRLTLQGNPLPLDGIQCQTVLSKCLGPFEDWEKRIAVSAAAGYNMVHFTPLQALGGSNSAYSLRDHMALNEAFRSHDLTPTFEDVKRFTRLMETDFKLLSLTDIVLNHTSNETPWLREHPECSFNALNSPHLRPAMLLDQEIYLLSMRAMRGETQSVGIPTHITQEWHVQAVENQLRHVIVPGLRLHEFYIADIDGLVKKFEECPQAAATSNSHTVSMFQTYTRFGAKCDITEARRTFRNSADFRSFLEMFNSKELRRSQDHLNNAVENVVKGLRYSKVEPWGPKEHEITKNSPLIVRYFLPNNDSLSDEISAAEMEACFQNEKGAYIMAHNGWVMGDNPLRNFALEGSMVYLRRELIAWGDCCKLRYGESPADCPFLWDYMKNYVQSSAEIFHGLRLDNCHSTPIHVAEYLLDAARSVRNDLYVIAELFTSSEAVDHIFVNRLGINSLIREALQASDSDDLGRLVHRYGGIPVGSFFHPQGFAPLMPSVAHAILLDMTHDNPSPYEIRSIYDFLPSAALVSMAACATGSSRGYDELVPHHIHVVHEDRPFQSLDEAKDRGIMEAKKILNDLHHQLGLEGFTEVYVDRLDADTVSVTRRCSLTDESVILVARTSFRNPRDPKEIAHLKPLQVAGQIRSVIIDARLVKKWSINNGFARNSTVINGIEEFECAVKSNIPLSECSTVRVEEFDEGDRCEIHFVDLTPGSVVAFRVGVGRSARSFMENARTLLKPFGYFGGVPQVPQSIRACIDRLDLDDLNRILFRSDQEEKSDGLGFGAYNLNNVGPMNYCGLQGVMTHLMHIRPRNDLGHPLCSNIREGDWLIDYMVNRLRPHKSCNEFASLLEEMLRPVKNIPHYLKPCYFDAVVTALYNQLLEAIWRKMSSFVSRGSNFVRQISLASVILTGFVCDSPLPPLSSELDPPAPLKLDIHSSDISEECPTLAAGLPHFSTGYMRNWGRDTFISLRGLLLLTGRFSEARSIILGFAGTLRHGLIPNLLDRGTNSRYNCRDAVWFWLECIKQYAQIVPQGELILRDPVSRLYPQDDSEALPVDSVVMPLYDVIQEALQKHWSGTSFRERNAGTRIDSQMKDPGFNVSFGVDHTTGFVFGGNEFNCGTWMDKMGSVPGKNQGIPASPRDGSAVELVGLCKSVISWLHEKHAEGIYPYASVELEGSETTFAEWSTRIQTHFESCFFVPEEGAGAFDQRPDLINRRGIYKDTFGSRQPWADYQFRPNFTIAMVVAPELFDVQHARGALSLADRVLRGPLGMRTLDPRDMTYNGNYNNSDSDAGFNYHRGPEWLWPTGYFLRAKLSFATDPQAARSEIRRCLQPHLGALENSPWRGLPELTNQDGAECHHSCPIQAWSHSCLLEVMHQLHD
ncbi:glycogen debranching enzyme-like [Galendromus occidentalis]|uniref:Glycogen debranching enzyme n=1 Tax=Galendromus occidentalis TaxID=34638 RepID=A0AAJ7SG78_9ACAR|nr:glycogen debranching enzyme-like [Galendromus occidentalis]